jgi:tRNA pseudouridine32 synthase/23S rRNA pseudouridine746 synthase
MARGMSAQQHLSLAFAGRRVHKHYTAVVQGLMAEPPWATDAADALQGWGLIDLPIAADWPRRPLRIIDQALGKPSQTRWRSLRYNADTNTTKVELIPITGRSHQLRVHMQALGHPILGDALYAPAQVQAKAERLLLHACELRFLHPAGHERMAFENSPGF